MTRSQWLWPIVIVVSSLAAGLVVFADIQSPVRALIIWWFLLVCPGMAFVRALRFEEPVITWSLSIALSVALDAIVAGLLLYTGRWSPPIGLAILIGLSLIGAILQLRPVPDRLTLPNRQELFKRGSLVVGSIVLAASLTVIGLTVVRLVITPAARTADPYQMAIMADRPAGYWRLDESGGATAFDRTGQTPGVIVGDVTYGQPGVLASDHNGALGFDGTNSYVSIGYSEDLDIRGDFTIEAWARPALLNKTQTVLHKGRSPSGDAWQYRLALTDKNLWRASVRVNGQTYELATKQPAMLDHWTYLALTRNGDNLTFYVDGSAVATTTVMGDFSPDSGILAIGRTGSTDSGYFTGAIGEVAIYPEALSADRITAHYRAAGVIDPVQTPVPSPAAGN